KVSPVRPAAKSAAKVTRPVKPAAKPASKPTANGTHQPANGLNGAARPAPSPTVLGGTRPGTAVPPSRPGLGSLIPPKPGTPPAAKPPLSTAAKSAAPASPVLGKDIAPPKPVPTGPTKDRILLMVPDPYWLHAYWELTTQSVQRAEAALKQDWHGARPIIRLFDVTSQDTTSPSETPVRDIFIQTGCNNWYIDVPQPPRTYRADIGYLSRRGEFFVLARSNQVTPPRAGSTEALDVGWTDLDAKKAERILAMSSGFETSDGDPELKRYLEEKLRRPMGAPKDTAFGTGASLPASIKKFFF